MAPEQMEGHPSALPPWEVHQHAHTKCGSGQAISPEGKQISTRDPHRGVWRVQCGPCIGPGGRYGGKKENWWHSKQKTGPKKSMETNWAKSWKNLGGFHHKKIGAPHHVTSEKIFSKVSKKCGKFPKMINNRRSLEGGSARVTARRTGWQPGARSGGAGRRSSPVVVDRAVSRRPVRGSRGTTPHQLAGVSDCRWRHQKGAN